MSVTEQEKTKYLIIGSLIGSVIATISLLSVFGFYNYFKKPDYSYALIKDSYGVHMSINNRPHGGGGNEITFNEILQNNSIGLPTITETLPESNLTGDIPLSRLEVSIKR